MGYVVKANVVVPEVYTDYAAEKSIYSDRLYLSGIVGVDPLIGGKMDGGGTTINMPFWKDNDVIGAAATAVDEATTLTPANITASKMVAGVQMLEKAFGQNDLASVLAGSNPQDRFTALLDKFWSKNLNAFLFSSVQGVIADNVANDSSSLVTDITSASNTKINSDAVIDTIGKFGDMDEDVSAIAMHSAVRDNLRKLNLIETVPDSQQNIMWETYLGKKLIIDDSLKVSSTYWTVIFKQNAFMYGESFNGYVPNEEWRNPLASGGQTYLVTRKKFVLHPYGFAYTPTGTGTFPTFAEVAAAAQWNNVMSSVKNNGFSVLKSLG